MGCIRKTLEWMATAAVIVYCLFTVLYLIIQLSATSVVVATVHTSPIDTIYGLFGYTIASA